jgi:holo-[acyl-carrier protein] synthase
MVPESDSGQFFEAAGVGTDLVAVERIERALERHGKRFVERILTPEERIAYQQHANPANYLAKAFAAKEALSKALGTGIAQGVGFHDFAIQREPSGKPCVAVSGAAESHLRAIGKDATLLLSLSDDNGWVQAFSVLSLSS